MPGGVVKNSSHESCVDGYVFSLQKVIYRLFVGDNIFQQEVIDSHSSTFISRCQKYLRVSSEVQRNNLWLLWNVPESLLGLGIDRFAKSLIDRQADQSERRDYVPPLLSAILPDSYGLSP